jgi:hypothetical protein
MQNNYETLGISQDATANEIETGYQKMLELHQEEIAAEPQGIRWCFIQIARDTLLDNEKRAKHDLDLAGLSAPSQKETPSLVTQVNAPSVPQMPARPQASAPPAPPTRRPAPAWQTDASTAPVQKPAFPENKRKTPVTIPEGAEGLVREKKLLSNIVTPVINWEAMQWFNKDYSRFKEKITVRQPGLAKGFWGSIAFFLSVFLVAVYAGTFPFPQVKGFPLNGLFALIACVFWYKYFNFSWGKKTYLIGLGAFSALSVSSILFGKHEGSSIVLAIVIALVCMGTMYMGLVGAKNASRWTRIQSSRQIIRKKLSTKEIRNTKTWGTAGNLDDAIEKFGAQAVALGLAGEKFTAEFMEKLLKIPGTRIFHGLEFPGSDNADVDHAIINGDKIVFVDSKMWKAGHYRWEWDGVIEQNANGEINRINTNFHHAVVGHAKRLPEAQIRSHILIYSASGRPVTVDNSNMPRPNYRSEPVTEMIAAQEFYEEVGNWFSEGTPGYINKSLVSALYSKLKP